MSTTKPEFTENYEESHFHEFETREAVPQKNGAVRMVESVRLGLTLLALLAAITIIGTAGDTLMVFNSTTLAGDFNLSLWPADFDVRPTVALVTCGAVVLLASAISLVFSKIPAVCSNLQAFISLLTCASRYEITHLFTAPSHSLPQQSASSLPSLAHHSFMVSTLRTPSTRCKPGPANGPPLAWM
jgi:hypothetical protein